MCSLVCHRGEVLGPSPISLCRLVPRALRGVMPHGLRFGRWPTLQLSVAQVRAGPGRAERWHGPLSTPLLWHSQVASCDQPGSQGSQGRKPLWHNNKFVCNDLVTVINFGPHGGIGPVRRPAWQNGPDFHDQQVIVSAYAMRTETAELVSLPSGNRTR